VQLYDSANSFDPVQIIESHESTVTSVRFLKEPIVPQPDTTPSGNKSQLSLLTASADKSLAKYSLMRGKQLNDLEPFELVKSESYNNKIFSMDVSSSSSLVLTGHDQTLTLSSSSTFQMLWQKRPDPSRKVVPHHLKVMIDEYGKVAVTSTTDRQLMMFDTESGRLLAKVQCGEIITGMCFSDNKRHIITTSS